MRSTPITLRLNLFISILVAWLSGLHVLAQMTPPPVPASNEASNSSNNLQSPLVDSIHNETRKLAATPETREPAFATDYSIVGVPPTQHQQLQPQQQHQQHQHPIAITQDLPQASPNNATTTVAPPAVSTAVNETDLRSVNTTIGSKPAESGSPPTTTAASALGLPETTPETVISQQSNPLQQPFCSLGDDTYQIGERWNPNLPPFGVQVCVLCECTVRQRKSCYEAKVVCRRITNECPVIDSCPDGKKPVTVAGQCCKSCQSATSQSSDVGGLLTAQQAQQQTQASIGARSPAYESSLQSKPAQTTSFRIVYMNERTKDYMTLVKNLPACPVREIDSPAKTTPQPVTSATPTPTPILAPLAPKTSKGGRNDLNGIDTRLAFKSLQDGASYIGAPSKSRQSTAETATSDGRFDHSSDDHQHPNDVQSATASNRNHLHQSVSASYATVSAVGNARQAAPNSCNLGNDTFQVGDVWNPILPPFGVQVCVQCNCIFRLRKGCFETKVTCRRINRDCPTLEVCPDGQPAINVDGQCCKTCPFSLVANSSEQESIQGGSNIFQPTTLPLNGIMRNEKVYKEFYTLTRNLNMCVKSRESVDIYNTSRYARRSRRNSAEKSSTNK